jgi:membrane associated rhomboid family serine protease
VGKILFVSAESLSPEVESYPLRGGRRPLTVHASGVRHAAPWIAGGEGFTGFEEITDISLGRRGLRIGTLRNTLLLPRKRFLDAGAPERLAAALIDRIGRLPGGSLQLARMAALEQRARSPRRLPATWVVIALCLVVQVAEWAVGPDVQFAGYFGSTLFFAGEYWRLVTGNFLHGGLTHLLLNIVGLWVLGELVERPLGSSRTVVIIGASLLGAMGAGAAAGYEDAVGASGIVCGLAAAALVLEFRIPERLPAAWRIPRRLFLLALGGDALLSLLPQVAGAAHLGGFAAGLLAALAVTPKAPSPDAAPGWVRATAIGLAIGLGLAGLTFAREVVGGPDVLARRAERLLSLPSVSPLVLNNTAWMIVMARHPSREQIDLALRSAQRAVAQTERADPNLLDTLAETQFLAGRSDDAIDTIDEAIALAPGEIYFVEQRRRFTGERSYDDRPSPPRELDRPSEPAEQWPDPTPRRPALPPGHPPIDDDPGISV